MGRRDDAGKVLPEGEYRPRVHLQRDRRTITIPNQMRVDMTPPVIEEGERGHASSRRRRRRRDQVVVSYRFSEPAKALLYVNGTNRVVTLFARERDKIGGTAASTGARYHPARTCSPCVREILRGTSALRATPAPSPSVTSRSAERNRRPRGSPLPGPRLVRGTARAPAARQPKRSGPAGNAAGCGRRSRADSSPCRVGQGSRGACCGLRAEPAGECNCDRARAVGGPVGCLGLALLLAATGRVAAPRRPRGVGAGARARRSPRSRRAPAAAAAAAAGALARCRGRVTLSSAGRGCSPFARSPACRPGSRWTSATEANLLVPLYVVVGAPRSRSAGSCWRGDERARELGPLALPLAAFVGWSGLSLAWSERRARRAAIGCSFFFLPFGLLAVGSRACLEPAAALLGLYGALAAMAVVFAASASTSGPRATSSGTRR